MGYLQPRLQRGLLVYKKPIVSSKMNKVYFFLMSDGLPVFSAYFCKLKWPNKKQKKLSKFCANFKGFFPTPSGIPDIVYSFQRPLFQLLKVFLVLFSSTLGPFIYQIIHQIATHLRFQTSKDSTETNTQLLEIGSAGYFQQCNVLHTVL